MLTNITASNWPTSGTATTATTGLATLSGTSLVHVGSNDLPEGSRANGYVEGALDAALTVGIDSFANAFSAGNRYSQTFWFRYVKTGTTTVGNNARLLDANGDGTRVILNTWAFDNGVNFGISILTGTGTAQNLSGQGASANAPYISFDQWTQVTLDVDLTVGNAAIRFYINGMLVGQATELSTTGTASLAEVVALVLRASGCKVQICGPFTSDNNAANTIKPLIRLRDQSTKLTALMLPMSFVGSRGCAWTFTSASATTTRANYATSGTANPARTRQVLGGSGAATFESMPIGSLPYNNHGWCTIAFPHLALLGSGSTMEIAVRNAANDTDLITLTCDGTNILQGATVLAPFNRTSRYAVLLHLSSDGKASITITNLSISGQQYLWSARLGNWSPSSIGPLQIRVNVSSGDAPEIDGAYICRYCDLVGVDSLSHANVVISSPDLAGFNHVALRFPTRLQDIRQVPGSINYDNADFSQLGIVVGRSGQSLKFWWVNAGQYMTHTRAVRVIFLDGGSINDLSFIDDTNRVANMAAWRRAADDAVSMIVGNKNRLWLTTMIRREQGGYTATQLREIDTYNGYVRQSAQLAQRVADGVKLIEFSEVAYSINDHAALFSVGDNVHPSSAGSDTIYETMIANKTTNTNLVDSLTFNGSGETLATEPDLLDAENRIKNHVTAMTQ